MGLRPATLWCPVRCSALGDLRPACRGWPRSGRPPILVRSLRRSPSWRRGTAPGTRRAQDVTTGRPARVVLSKLPARVAAAGGPAREVILGRLILGFRPAGLIPGAWVGPARLLISGRPAGLMATGRPTREVTFQGPIWLILAPGGGPVRVLATAGPAGLARTGRVRPAFVVTRHTKSCPYAALVRSGTAGRSSPPSARSGPVQAGPVSRLEPRADRTQWPSPMPAVPGLVRKRRRSGGSAPIRELSHG